MVDITTGPMAGKTVLVTAGGDPRWMPSPPTCHHRPRCGGWPVRSWRRTRAWTCWSITWAGSGAPRRVTADGLEHTLAVNNLASFLLTELLLDREGCRVQMGVDRGSLTPPGRPRRLLAMICT
jgi:hypothetical protein